MCSDDNTKIQEKMNVTHILVKTKFTLVLNEAFNVQINGEICDQSGRGLPMSIKDFDTYKLRECIEFIKIR